MRRDGDHKTSRNSGQEFRAHPILLSKREVESLLDKLCVDLGFCLPPKPRARIIANPPRNPHRFSEVVMKAEGFESAGHSELFEQVFGYVLHAFEISGQRGVHDDPRTLRNSSL